MPSAIAHLLDHLCRLTPSTRDDVSDAALLRCFCDQHDETAFADLVARHGPLVLRVCRRILDNDQDIEDAFQATFLTLARKAGTIRRPESLAAWLHGVARRVSLKAIHDRYRSRGRRGGQQSLDRLDPRPGPLDELSARELLAAVDEEVERLPEVYRLPVLLCCLEGLSQEEVAARLGWTAGSVKGRLERGRRMLHDRLARRGLTLAAALMALEVSRGKAAVVAASLAASTARATYAAADGGVAARVRLLAEEGTKRMTSAKMAAGIGALLAGLVVGGFAVAEREKAQADSPPAKVGPAPVREAARPATDAPGDPLPPGALMRLGTRRHRVQGWHSLPDGKSYLSVSASEIRRVDSATGRFLETCPLPGGHHVVGISPDGRHVLLTTSFIFYTGFRAPGQKEEQDWVLTLYDRVNRKAVWTNREKLEAKDWKVIDSTCFSADGKWIATRGHALEQLRVWDGTTGKELWHRKTAQQPLGFTEGGNTLVTRSGNSIYLLHRATGKDLRGFPTVHDKELQQCSLAPDGSAVLLHRSGPTIRVWDIATGKERAPLAGPKEGTGCLAFSRDGKVVATGGNDPFVLVRDWPSGKVTCKIAVRPRGISVMAISGDGQRLEALYWGEQALHFYDLKTGKAEPAPLECHQGNVQGVAFAPDGSLLSLGKDATVRTWDLKTCRATGRLAVEVDLNASGFAVSRDGRLLAVPHTDNKTVSVIERATGKLVRKLPLERWEGRFLTFSADGRWLAGTDRSHEGNIRVWEIATGKAVLKLNDRVTYGVSCTFSPDGRQFAASGEGKVRFWEVGTWKEQAPLPAYAPLGLAFSPDGRTLAAAGVDGIRLFELATHGERGHIGLWVGSGYPCGILQFSRSGRWLAWQGSATHVWDTHSGKPLGSFTGHEDSVTGLAFTADERALATSSADSTLLIWDVAGRAAKQPPVKGGDVDQAWQGLAGADAKAAYEAMRVLAAAPDTTVRRIAQQIKPVAPLDTDRLAACLRDLDSVKFEVRVRAKRDLEQMGEPIAAPLERFLKGKPSLEVRKRVEEVLASVTNLTRELRALEVLERIGDDRAQAVLKALARGTPEARLTRDAHSALQRLSKRPGTQ